MASSTTLVVGIDVGMTCTGVAFAIKNEGVDMPEPYTIQTWPGNHSSTSDKVPTSICYTPDGRISWGFQTQHEQDPHAEIKDWFKIFFDPEEYERAKASDPESVPNTYADVKRYYEDYLRKLYPHIKKAVQDNVLDWDSAHIEFLFSVPTTWTKLGLSSEFKKLARVAGFGVGTNHIVDVSLTEAEAAAVHTFTAQSAVYSDGDVILVVDAGGGTTDLALMKVSKRPGERPVLRSLDEVRGDEIGSVEIDMAFADMAKERLFSVSSQLPGNLDEQAIDDIADRMARKYFRHHKEEFGEEDTMSRPEKHVEIGAFGDALSIPEGRILRGKMVFTNTEIQGLFDEQLRKMFRLIDFQLQRMANVAPNDHVTHIVLSGGLGSSPYLKNRLVQRYTVDSLHRYAPDVRVISCARPQLAVVKGLVQDRMEKLKTNRAIIGPRVCRQSLGVVCNQIYDPKNISHQRAQLRHDSLDGTTYAMDQITWFVEQGQTIDSDIVDHPFFRKFLLGDRSPWITQIAICNSRKAVLPTSLNDDGVKLLCTMKSDLTKVPAYRFEKRSKRNWWKCWAECIPHYQASYKIRFLLKPACVDSELWFDGEKFGEAKDFEVTWEAGANMAAPKEHQREELDYYGDERVRRKPIPWSKRSWRT